MFYFLVGMLLTIAIIFILWPLWSQVLQGKQASAADVELPSRVATRAETNVTLYQDHLDDLTKTFADGSINEAQYRQLKAELARSLLNDSEDNNAILEMKEIIQIKMTAPWFARGFFISGLFILPILAVVIYQHLGANNEDWKVAEQLDYKYQLLQQPASVDQRRLNEINRELLEKIEGSIKNTPGNTQTWVLHARIAVEIQEFDKAINSYRQALELQPQSSQIMAELAQALYIGAGNRVASAVETLSTKTLAIDPNNIMALSLMGMMAFNTEKYVEAIEFWQQVSALVSPNTADAQTLQQGIAQAQSRLAMKQSADNDSTTRPPASAAGDSKTDKASPGITVAVSLADNINFQPEQTVFVYARAWKGSKMPLAITKLQAGQLPLTIVLDESMAMSPSMTLAMTQGSAGRVELVARLSLSGEPAVKPGDWQVSYGPVTWGENAKIYPLMINQIVQ